MWMPDSPLSGLCYLSLDRRILVSDLRLARTLVLDLVHFPYPLAYGVGIVERDACTPRQGDSTSGVAGRSHYTGLLRTDDAWLRHRLPARACYPQASCDSCTVRRHTRHNGSR